MLFVACAGEKSDKSTLESINPVKTAAQTTSPSAPLAVANSQVPHFYCASNCKGGVGDAKAPCPVCGVEMVHNQEFHANDQAQPQAPQAEVQNQPEGQPTGKQGESRIELPMTEVSTRLASGRTIDQLSKDTNDEMKARALANGGTPAGFQKAPAGFPAGLQQTPAGLPPGLQQQGLPPSQEPAQNAAGVWHFTCPSGCSGGAGAQQACGSCGATLAHNAGYH